MGERPKLKIELTNTDKAVEIIALVLIFFIWVLTVTNYKSLPDLIPTHFNGAGEANGFNEKKMIFALPLLAAVIFIGMTILNKYPHIFNYPTKITSENALKEYTNATRFIRYLKVTIILIFGLISYQIIRLANGQTEGLGVWFLPMTFGLVFAPIIYSLIKSSQSSK